MVLLICPVEFLSLFGNDRAVVELACPIWPAGGAVLCIQRLFNDLYCSLPQYGASPTGNVHSGYLYGSEYLFELGIYFRKSGSARTGSSRAALATLIARVLEVVIVACHMARNRIFRVRWRLVLRPGKRLARQFLMCSGPVVLNETLWGLGTSMYPTVMGHMAAARRYWPPIR